MSVKIASWNVGNGLGDESKMPGVIDWVKRTEADAFVFPEAYIEGQEENVEAAKEELGFLGYLSVSAELYQDEDGRFDNQGMLMAIRTIDSEPDTVRLATRNALRGTVIDEQTGVDISLLGVHLDDRSEANRLAQAEEIIYQQSDIVAGDFNSDHRQYRVGKMASRLPAHFSTAERSISKLERALNIAQRTGQMAASGVYKKMKPFYEDANHRHSRTWGPRSSRLFEFDRIMVINSPYLNVLSFERHDKTPLSDHTPISAVIET